MMLYRLSPYLIRVLTLPLTVVTVLLLFSLPLPSNASEGCNYLHTKSKNPPFPIGEKSYNHIFDSKKSCQHLKIYRYKNKRKSKVLNTVLS